MPQVRVDHHTVIDYFLAGDSGPQPDLLLIHGTGGTARSNWEHLAPGLTDGRRVIAPDLAGSGATTDHGGRLELPELVAQAGAAADDAGAQRYDVVGFSLGAAVAAALAATHPERVRRLVLIGGWASSADGRAQLLFGLWHHLHRTDPGALARLFTLTGFSAPFLAKRPPQVVERMVERTLATLPPGIGRQAELDGRLDLTALLPSITAPTLVVAGTHDAMVPPAGSGALAAAIAGAQYLELDSGHLVLFEQPAALTDAISRFLA